MKEIMIGTKNTSEVTVTKELSALSAGSGELLVYATPMMVALMENSAANCIKSFLNDGETTVGTYVEVSHTSATPLGMKVTATSEVVAVNGREIEFIIEASDERGIIGNAKHKRFVVNSEKFQQKTNSK